ncbi:hypothetical protein M419DRAFT_8985 [Trichoderma reesei RUT C-30]|jgi:hypothetical protein|uniref:Uncharacterized protein n=1 Tax=Hypocrea jecorina (strain ATCC 56765 / BCRC 32924 / NRRL 11460 / Rut C-30) TaxID=1344414 RepID=A0A024S8Q1_HYPJR|nr:hypothetical protein M419DRAFT_8985 [Trichoderma reesei RUT C-30]
MCDSNKRYQAQTGDTPPPKLLFYAADGNRLDSIIAKYLEVVHYGRVHLPLTRLSYASQDAINMSHGLDDFEVPPPPLESRTTVVDSAISRRERDERTVRLIGSAADEARWHLTRSIDCESTEFTADVLPLPGSEWRRKASDEDVYGIPGAGFLKAFLVSVPLGSVDRGLLPDVGTSVQIYTQTSISTRMLRLEGSSTFHGQMP